LRRASLGGHHAGTVPGAAKVEEPAEDPIGSGDFKGDADCGECSSRRQGNKYAHPADRPGVQVREGSSF
jgi:hypothetical protein